MPHTQVQSPSKLVLLLLVAAVTGSAQSSNLAADTLTAQMVKTGLYLISGGGGNSVVRLSGNGLIVVDGKLPGNYDALLKKMKKISDQRVRVLINSNYHEQHTATNARFRADGTQIIAHENVKESLANYNPPGGKVAPPTITYAKDYTLKLGGVEARLLYFGSALTNGDTVVYFPDLKVIVVGDLFAASADPDFSAGGSVATWAAALAQVLKLDFDVVVPGAGPVVARADLEAFQARLVRLSESNSTASTAKGGKNKLENFQF